MGRDRYVRWGEKAPTNVDVLSTARDFFGPSAAEKNIGREQYAFRLPMRFSDPKHPLAGCAREDGARVVEVIIAAEYVNVETRMTDRFTDAVADELAATLSWYYGGTIEEGVSQREYARFEGKPFYQSRAAALEKAINAAAHGGIPRDKFAKWATSLGWRTPTAGREEWEHPSMMGSLGLSMFAKVTFADVEFIARTSKKSLAASLEEIFGDEA